MNTFADDLPFEDSPLLQMSPVPPKPLRVLVFDFETIRDPRSTPFIPEKGPRDRTDPSEKIACDPNYNQICVAGFCEDGESWSVGQNDFGHSEKILLEEIWKCIQEYDTIVGYNSFSFDYPLLLRRSWYHGVKPTKLIDTRKYVTGNHIDVRMILSGWDKFAPGKLDLYAQLKLGIGKTEGMDGGKVQAAWNESRYDDVKIYCEQDCLITWKLYESLRGYYL